MIKIHQVKIPLHGNENLFKDNNNKLLIQKLKNKCAKILGVSESDIVNIEILRRSLDARKKGELAYVYQVVVTLLNESKFTKSKKFKTSKDYALFKPVSFNLFSRVDDSVKREKQQGKIIIVGAGPAGLFCAYQLSKAGYSVLILERGKKVEERTKDVEQFFETGVLNTASNVQFGEGGAGTFSDGKLNTLVKDQMGRNKEVLNMFVKHGADEAILYDQKPHIGTDVLRDVIASMRGEIQNFGGEYRFESQVVDLLLEQDKVTGVKLSNGEEILADAVVLAVGHSARDTFEMLLKKNVSMEAKPFAVGFRVEHPQELVNKIQYKEFDEFSLPAAAYKVTAQGKGRGVYSFCMCPGGYVVNASSEEGHQVVNGMSYHDRAGENANSAMIVAVNPSDYPDDSPLAGVHFQKEIEKRAFEIGKGCIPQQLFGDFEKNITSQCYGEIHTQTRGKTVLGNLRGILPEVLNESFIEGMHEVGEKVPGFDRDDVVLSGIESRTSSPIRIHRDEKFESNLRNLYPCGEGAGYAGGIMSAAMDGLKVAEQLVSRFVVS